MTRRFLISASVSEPMMNDPAHAALVLEQAEQSGIDLLVLGREDALHFDPLVLAAWAAPRVKRMGIVACVPASLSHPFHVARSLSAIDFLSGGMSGWAPAAAGAPEKMAEDMVEAARSLWDGWAADTLIIDKASGRYLDSRKVRASNYAGPFFQVSGPVNAMRPPQGHPVLVSWQGSIPGLSRVDLGLGNGTRMPEAALWLASRPLGEMRENLEKQFKGNAIDGVHCDLGNATAEIGILAEKFASLSARKPADGTLRQRLGLATP